MAAVQYVDPAARPHASRVVSRGFRAFSATRPVHPLSSRRYSLRLWRRGGTLCRLRRSALRFLGDIRRGHEPIEELVEVLVECLVVDLDAVVVERPSVRLGEMARHDKALGIDRKSTRL